MLGASGACESSGRVAAVSMMIALSALVLLASAPSLANDDGGSRSIVGYGPDLAVSGAGMVLSKPVILDAVPFNLTVSVYNLGDFDAFQVDVSFLVDGEVATSEVLTLVPISGPVEVSRELVLAKGEHQLAVWVDADDKVDERREDNNGATLTVTVRGLPDVVVPPEGITVSDPHPMEGDVITIGAEVRNEGETQATLVVVQFWDGPAGTGTFIANRTTSVAPGGTALVSAPWDTTSLGGTHQLTVLAGTVLPGEDDPADNVAFLKVLVFTIWDMVVDDVTGDVTIDQTWTQDGFVTVRSGHTLTVEGIELVFLQDYDYQFAVFVEDGAGLVLLGASVRSDAALLVVLEGSARLSLTDGSNLEAAVDVKGGASIEVEAGRLAGGIVGGADEVVLTDALLSGPLELSGTWLTATGVELAVTGPITMTGGRAVLTDCLLTGGAEPSIDLRSGADMELHNVTCGSVVTDLTSKAIVFRLVEVLVVDESTLVVPHASVSILHFINGTVVATATGGDDGTMDLDVASDVIEAGQYHFIGNYRVLAAFSVVSSETPLLLEPFPNVALEANRPALTVVLPPVEPRALVGTSAGDLLLEAAAEPLDLVADFIQDGSIIVRGTLNVVSSQLSVLQDRDHQFYVLVEGEGVLTLNGGTLTSAHHLNVYLYDSAQLVLGEGSLVAVNAIVAQDQATITATNSTISGRLLLRGGAVLLQSGCHLEGDHVVLEVPSVSMRGGSLAAELVTMDSPTASFEGVAITAAEAELAVGLCNLTGCTVEVSALSVRATIMTIMSSVILTDSPMLLNVSTFYGDSSTFNNLIDGLPPFAKVYLYDATIPRPFTLCEATVLVYWYLTVRALDSLGNLVGGAAVEVSYTQNGTVVAIGQTNDDGEVRIPLLGSIVDTDGERFVGNYRIVVSSPADANDQLVYYIGLDQGRTVAAYFPEPLLPPTGVDIEVLLDNRTVVAGTVFTIRGVAIATYLVGRQPMYEGAVVAKLVSNSTAIWQNTTAVDATGAFAFTLTAPDRTGAYSIEVTVTGSGPFAGIEGRAHAIALDVVDPAPTVLFVVLTTDKILDHPLGAQLVIKGTVRYNSVVGRPVAGAKVLCKDDPTKKLQQAQSDGVGAFTFNYVSPPYTGQWNYFLTAKDEALDLTSAETKFTVYVVEAEKPHEEKDNTLLYGILIAIVVAVLVVAAVMAQMYLSSRGHVVECGECGTLVPESAKVCPRCGAEFETEVAKCSECGSWIPSRVDKCPYCGTEFRKPTEGGEEEQPPVGPGGEGDVMAEAGPAAEQVAPALAPAEGDAEAAPAPETPEGAPPVNVNVEVSVDASSMKRAPEGIAGAGPRPVVRRAVVAPKVDEEAIKAPEGDSRPRVRKVSKPPTQEGDGGK
jgi:RNA polymerase subunit RPABC4/transcription elongation factor Spt4